MLPYRPIGETPEILLMTTPEMGRDRLITSKNFYLRIMAETGILGTITFLTFVMVNLGYALYLRLSPEKEWQYWGTASLCGLIAFALCALTFDSFVIPDMWVIFGLITAAIRVATHENQAQRPYLLMSKNLKNTWTLREAIYTIFHNWPALLAFILVGCLLGWGLSYIWPSSLPRLEPDLHRLESLPEVLGYLLRGAGEPEVFQPG